MSNKLVLNNDINNLICELRENVNIMFDFCINESEYSVENIYKDINHFLNNKSEFYIYPRKSDFLNEKDSLGKFLCYKNILNYVETHKQKKYKFIKGKALFSNDVLSDLIKKDSVLACKKYRRLYLNLRHLNFAIKKANSAIYNYNITKSKFNLLNIRKYKKLKEVCFDWLFFRLHFFLVDFINSCGGKFEILDEEYFNNVRNMFNEK